jgi:hypothetical protein
MMKNKCLRLATPASLGVLASVFLLSSARGTMAQDQAESAEASTKLSAKVVRPTDANAAPSQRQGFVGPVQPPSRPGKAPRSRAVTTAKPRKRKAAGVPKATVVLKPGEVPAIKFDTPDYDFGRVQSGPDIIHDFWFTNTGTGPLEILKVKPG